MAGGMKITVLFLNCSIIDKCVNKKILRVLIEFF
jgi:hypothetical protein